MDSLITALVIVVLLFGGVFLVRVRGYLQRQQATARIGNDPVLHQARGVTIRILLHRTGSFHGMLPGRTYLRKADVAVTANRVVIASDRGVLADLGRTHGRRFQSVRATGPDRLVVEGDVPSPSGPPGHYRFELMVPEASKWAEDLQQWTSEDDPFKSYIPDQPTLSQEED